MKNIDDLRKKFNNLDMERLKICGYLSDYEIDNAIENDEFNFIGSLLIGYFDGKDIGYLLTKFEESGLKDKLADDVDFCLKEWEEIQEEIAEFEKERKKQTPDISLNGTEYIKEMVKRRRSEEGNEE